MCATVAKGLAWGNGILGWPDDRSPGVGPQPGPRAASGRGWFRETWRSDLTIGPSSLPPEYTGPRDAGTAILFLLMPGQQSAWHTVRSAELWFYHRGGPLLLEIGAEQSSATTHLLGSDITAGEHPQVLVPPGHWQRAIPATTSPAWSAAWWYPASTSPTSRCTRLNSTTAPPPTPGRRCPGNRAVG